MAPPHRWFDAFMDTGWPDVLTPSALRLILRVMRRVDRNLQTRAKLSRLQHESGLPARTFHLAKQELYAYGLMARRKLDDKWVVTLASALFGPPESAIGRRKKCNPLHKRVQAIAQGDGESYTATRRLGVSHQKTKAQLEGKSVVQQSPVEGVEEFSEGLDIPPSVWRDARSWGEPIVREVSRLLRTATDAPDVIDGVVFELSRLLQSAGVLASEVEVRLALDGLHLRRLVASAIGLFGGEVVVIREAAR